jgi:hypothetical protein
MPNPSAPDWVLTPEQLKTWNKVPIDRAVLDILRDCGVTIPASQANEPEKPPE